MKVVRRDGQRFESATWLHKAQSLPKEQFKAEVERELTGRDFEPSDFELVAWPQERDPSSNSARGVLAWELVLA